MCYRYKNSLYFDVCNRKPSILFNCSFDEISNNFELKLKALWLERESLES